MPEQEPRPKAYTSEITLFECPGCIARCNLSHFIELFHGTGIILSDYIHELWRTGRMKVVYDILMYPDMTLKLEDIVKTGDKTRIQGADIDEVEGFFTDVVSTITKVENGMEYEEEFTEIETEDIRLRAEAMMTVYEEDLILA